MYERNHYFPIFIDMKEKRCIVYGGGSIAARRVKALLRFGARVTVYAPQICRNLSELKREYPETLTVYQKHYESPVPSADFVFSCVNDTAVDAAIHTECKERSIPVNIASDQGLCDFYFPALVEQDEMVIGISSGGKNHKKVRELAAKLREWMGCPAIH